jgi:cysteine desulfurase
VAAAEFEQKGERWREQLHSIGEWCRSELQQRLPQAILFGATAPQRLNNTLFFALPGIEAQSLIMQLDRSGFAIGSGSACGSEQQHASHVLQAMGVSAEVARGAVRISLGRHNSRESVSALLAALQQAQQSLSSMASVGW